MATLALSVAGQAIGGAVGGPFGAMVGRALGALAGSAIDAALFGEKPGKVTGSDIALQGSSEGGAVPRVYGWSRLGGNIIWATELEEIAAESQGAKASGTHAETGIAASFALALCEGEVQHLGRIWADGQVLETEGLTIRFYRGDDAQMPDSLIEAVQGDAPAYRGLCYLVFERLPLAPFGNRIPNINVEICRALGELEPAIRAVTVIPGATEFGYDPTPRVRIVGPGTTAAENTHLSAKLSDWTLSLDELQALCPNLKSVALVVAWFGDDLRCGHCRFRPKVEAGSRQIEGTTWQVAGVARGAAAVVSGFGGGPAYGGTPSDAAVLAAVADLKARGLKVTLYPIVLMDIPPGNGLPDPYGWGSEQGAYPWRGRITCDPAPGRAGSPDGTAGVNAQVDSVVDGTWGLRRMILHYAGLAATGGADALLIGSELRGLTTLRGADDGFPFVQALVDLAEDVRAIVGQDCRLTYAADWSEYSGHQPDGAKFFHLDPLWASPDIDAVGIDNYMPVGDRRDGSGPEGGGYDLAALGAGIGGGEGYDWYYASDADRIAGIRSPISDGAYGEPWVWRYKDLVNWWSQSHYDRPGGVRAGLPTAWVPESKPIWFTELGCGAVDKGANQPNVFVDAKSMETGRPYFSTGLPDALMQRQFLRAHVRHWMAEGAHNPVSGRYDGRMIDAGDIYLWTWDARPYPAFPQLHDVWADGVNHATGHWLTGRLGAMASDELAAAVARDFGAELVGTPAAPLIHGLKIEGVATAREALEPLLAATGLGLRDRAEGLDLLPEGEQAGIDIGLGEIVVEDGARLVRRQGDGAEAAGRLALAYFDRERSYLAGTATALRGEGVVATAGPDLVLDPGGARLAAERMLAARNAAADSIGLTLPPSRLALEIGDRLELDGAYRITEIVDYAARQVVAQPLALPLPATSAVERPAAAATAPVPRALPLIYAAHLPPDAAQPGRSRLVLAAHASPWPGVLSVEDEASGRQLAAMARRATLGVLAASLPRGAPEVWDDATDLTVTLYAGHLASRSDAAVLAGANRLAVEGDGGAWEIVGFAEAELVAPATYRLGRLRRGMDGSEGAIDTGAAGKRCFVLDERCAAVPVEAGWLGQTLALRAYAGADDLTGEAFAASIGLSPVLPLPPADLASVHDGSGDIVLSWRRRSRAPDNGWGGAPANDYPPEAYRVVISQGGVDIRTLAVSAPVATYSLAQQTADFGGPAASFGFSVAQVSAGLGPGHAATADYPA